MKILIVVLNWNSREMTEQCLQSLLAMEGSSFDILVVDNGSTDRTADIVRARGARVFAHEWRDDFSAARNAAR